MNGKLPSSQALSSGLSEATGVPNNASTSNTDMNNGLPGNASLPTTSHGVSAGSKCTYMDNCKLESPDRRVISHFFGRNKKETRAMPDECWVTYCRQHYQRCRYRMPAAAFAALQMDLVWQTVEKLEAWGGICSWEIAMRKRALDDIAKEDAARAAATTNGANGGMAGNTSSSANALPVRRERALLPHTGKGKSFAEVFALIAAVKQYAHDNDCEALEFEIVPQYHPGVLQARAPTVRRGKNVRGTSATLLGKCRD